MADATKSQSKGKRAKAPKAKPEAFLDDDNDAPVQKQVAKRKRDEEIVEGPSKKALKKTPAAAKASTKAPSKASKSTLSTLSAKPAKASQKPSAKPSSKASNPALSTLNDKPAARSANLSEATTSIPDILDIVGTYKITSTELDAKYNPPTWSGDFDDDGTAGGRYLEAVLNPYYEEPELKHHEPNFKISVYHEKINTKYQLFATFDFNNVSGLMRFENITPEPSSFTIDKSNNDAPRHIDSIPDVDHRGQSLTYKRKNFLLEAGAVPSTQNPTWRYRWRGRGHVNPEVETEGPVILHQTDKLVELITFKSSTQLTGTFNGMPFTGRKILNAFAATRKPNSPDEFWRDCGEREYRLEQVFFTRKAYKVPDCDPDEMGDENYAKIRKMERKAEKERKEKEPNAKGEKPKTESKAKKEKNAKMTEVWREEEYEEDGW